MLMLAATVLAVYAWSYSVALLPGPFGLFAALRSWTEATYGVTSWQDEGINCPICVAFWLAWPAAALVWYQGWLALDWPAFIVLALGIWGASVFLYRLGSEQ